MQNFETKLSFPCEIANDGECLISVFKDFFASIDKILILGGRLASRLSFYGALRS